MRFSRKALAGNKSAGIGGLLSPLMIISLLMSLSFPMVLSSLDTYQERVDAAKVRSQALELKGCAEAVFMAGPGNIRRLDIELLPSSFIEVGGKNGSVDSMYIRCYAGGRNVATEYLDDTPLRLVSSGAGATVLQGNVVTLLKCIELEGSILVTVEVGGDD